MSKRKSKTRPELIAEFEAEARRLGGGASENEQRFLEVATTKGKDLEPTGLLAGAHLTRPRPQTDR